MLLLAAWLLLLRVSRRPPSPAVLVAVGLLASAAAVARPFDAVLLLTAPLLRTARCLRRSSTLLRSVAWGAAGALPLVTAVLAYDRFATGSVLRLPFGLLEPNDKLGFGQRRLLPEGGAHDFGLTQSLQGSWTHMAIEPLTWFAGGALLLPLALVGLTRWRRLDAGLRTLLCSVGLFLLGYLTFWGPYFASILWGGVRTVGPFYALPLLLPAALAATAFVDTLRRAWSICLIPLALFAFVLNARQAVGAAGLARQEARQTAAVLNAVDSVPAGQQILVLADPPYLGHPVSGLVNQAGGERLALAGRFPVPTTSAGTPELLELPRAYPRVGPSSFVLRRTILSSGRRVPLAVSVSRAVAPVNVQDLLVVSRAGRSRGCRLATAAVVLDSSSFSGCSGAPVPGSWSRDLTRQCRTPSCLSLAVYDSAPGRLPRRMAWRRLPTDVTQLGVSLLTDGPVLRSSGGDWITVVRR